MKKLFLFSLFCSSVLFSQNFEDDWRGFFSFQNVVAMAEGDDRLFVAAGNAVMIYDIITKEIRTITPIQGLSGERISSLFYSESHNLIFIGYENGLIEIIRQDQSILKVVDILDKPSIPPNIKKINGFNQYEDKIYIAADFGISVFNLNGMEFGDSYYIGNNGNYIKVYQTEVFNNYIYAIGINVVKRADIHNPNLIHYSSWHTISGLHFKHINRFNGNLYAASALNQLYRFNGTVFEVIHTFPQTNINMLSNESYLTVVSETQAYTFDVNMVIVNSVTGLPDYDYGLSSGLAHNNIVYLGTKEDGVLAVPFGLLTAEQIITDGPLMNIPFALDASAGKLWVTYGDHTLTYNPYPLNARGISLFMNEKWTNVPFEDLFGAQDLSHVKINPYDPSVAYISSLYDGLLKIKDSVPEILYNETNSPIERQNPDPNGIGIRLLGSAFDKDGNLWFLQSMANTGIYKLSSSGQMQAFDIGGIIQNPVYNDYALTKLAIDRSGNLFFGTGKNGVIGYNPTTNKFKKMQEGLGNGNLPSQHVKSVAVDLRNQLWIGTFKGLRVYYNTAGFFDEGANIDSQAIIILENDIPQELLFQQTIVDIEVDGGNNKWVATASSGVFYLSPNGQETLMHFTKDNSPLPSNTVLDIAIDPVSGEVFFATLNGLVSYRGSRTAPRDNLRNLRAFPNPVRPGFNGNVTIDGLTDNANVKITDVSGNLVYEEISKGGSILWNTKAFGKYKVASGVYFIMATTEDASETNIAKLMIIR